jgi:Short C-terminal domain
MDHERGERETATVSSPHLAVHMRNLQELHRHGLLTDEEFESRRAAAVLDGI